MNKKIQTPDFLIGLIFMIIGLISFLKNVNVGTFHFRTLWGVNTGTIVLVLMIASFMSLIIKPNKITKSLLLISIIMLIIVIILSINITVSRMSILSLIIMLGMLFGGLALIIKTLIKK